MPGFQVNASGAHVWLGAPQLEHLESRIARGRMDAYNRVVDAEGLPRGLHDRALDLLLRGNLLTTEAAARLQKLRGAVARVRSAHTSDDLCTRSLLSAHAGLSLLALDCENYQRRLHDGRQPSTGRAETALALVAG